MDPALLVRRDGHPTRLKWHRARRHGSDLPFTGVRVLEGLRAGASVEVDLVVHGEGGFAVLHDLWLDRETTGTGPVRTASADLLRSLRLRGEDGMPSPHPVMLLEDLARVVAQGGLHPDALLQLDFKENQPIDEVSVKAFGRIVAPLACHLILSSGDSEAVRRLSEGVESLRTGHDPCHFGAMERLRETRDFAGFVHGALAEAPQADTIYLHHSIILAAAEAGHDLVEPVHRVGRRVDAYTIPRADAEGLAVAQRLLELRVDQITTDDPEGLGRALA